MLCRREVYMGAIIRDLVYSKLLMFRILRELFKIACTSLLELLKRLLIIKLVKMRVPHLFSPLSQITTGGPLHRVVSF